MQITGKTTYQNIAVGCWGIIDEQGQKWRMVNPPAELQRNGLHVRVEAQPAEESVSIFMWGKPIKITDFSILD
ncbi:hypothetical protein [Rhodoflexus caldus]|uniref:hypothetical protein n=1 Tax=Rhodoflexus caldus TaxID=2891236 RepID=UPI00202A16AB|nr:hypothetical protein [Rhodoflexus caldus]